MQGAQDPTAPPGAAAEAQPVLAIETRGLRKEYRRRVALHDLTLDVRPGEVFGFLGPNGAGKTTAVKILTGLVWPTAGTARIFGRPPSDAAARRRIGYLPEHFHFHEWATGAEVLDFHGRLAGMAPAARRERIPGVLARVGLADRGGDRVRRYSKGMTQRLGLAQAILHQPDLVLLDEPTSALDPVGRRDVRELIRWLAARGTTVFLNSHLLSEIELVCDRVAIVDRGRVVHSGRLDELAAGQPQLRLMLDRVDTELLARLVDHGEVAEVQGTAVTLNVPDVDTAPAVAELVVGAGYRLYGLVPMQPSLEDLFVSLVKEPAS